MKMNKKKLFLIFGVVPLALIIMFNSIIYKNEYITLNDFLVTSLFGSNSKLDKKVYVTLIDSLYYIVLFNFLYGSYIYNEFRSNCVYQFTRISNRSKWFTHKYFEIIMFAFLYSLLLIGIILIIGMHSTDDLPNIGTLSLFLRMLIMIFGILILTTIAINLLSIRFNSIQAFIMVYVVIIILVFVAVITEQEIPDPNNIHFSDIWNPLAGVILNSGENKIFQYVAAGYYIILSGIEYVIGRITVNRMDISLIDNESK